MASSAVGMTHGGLLKVVKMFLLNLVLLQNEQGAIGIYRNRRFRYRKTSDMRVARMRAFFTGTDVTTRI